MENELGSVACALSVAMVMGHAGILQLEYMFGNVWWINHQEFPTWTAYVEVNP